MLKLIKNNKGKVAAAVGAAVIAGAAAFGTPLPAWVQGLIYAATAQ